MAKQRDSLPQSQLLNKIVMRRAAHKYGAGSADDHDSKRTKTKQRNSVHGFTLRLTPSGLMDETSRDLAVFL